MRIWPGRTKSFPNFHLRRKKRLLNEGVSRRSEIWLVNWNSARGCEQVGIRPALIIQNDIGNERSPTTIVLAISGSVKMYPMNVYVEPPEGVLSRPCIVKASQILTISADRLEKRLGKLGKATMAKVNEAVRLSLNIP